MSDTFTASCKISIDEIMRSILCKISETYSVLSGYYYFNYMIIDENSTICILLYQKKRFYFRVYYHN